MRRSVTLHFVPTGFVLAVALLSPTAGAQSDPVAARTLFDEGRKLVTDGKYEVACPKFEESYKLDPGIGTLFNLADCWEHIGRTASAWARFLEVADAAGRAGQKDREQIARDRAAALGPKLSRLVVEVKSKDSGMELTKDGASFGAAQWGTALPIDPGMHTIEARAPSKQAWKKTVEVPSNGQTVTVTVPALEDEAKQATAPTRSGASQTTPPISPAGATATTQPASPLPAATAEQGPARETAVPSSNTTTVGWVLGGVGVAGLAVGTVFGLKFNSKNNEADDACPSGVHCLAEEQARYDSAIADANSAPLPLRSSATARASRVATGH